MQQGRETDSGTPRLITTRAVDPAVVQPQSAQDAALRAAGVQLHAFPLIHIVGPSDEAHAREALRHLQDWQLAIPVSPSAVQAALRLRDGAWPGSCAVGLIGAASREAFERGLRARGAALPQLLCASRGGADSEALWHVLRAWHGDAWQGTRVLILRGDGGRDWLAETLRGAGAEVDVLEVYRRVAPAADPHCLRHLRELLELGAPWQIGAASALHNLCGLLRAAGLQPTRELAQRRALVQHPRVAQAAREAGFGRVDLVESGTDALLRALRDGR